MLLPQCLSCYIVASTRGAIMDTPRHILTAKQFNPEELDMVFQGAEEMRQASASRAGLRELKSRQLGMQVATLFYEPSTRTRLSFESAADRLGIGVASTENAAEFSSAAKGETIEDTIRTVGRYTHAIVLRHGEDDAAERAAAVSTVPIINAGSGKLEHPTQAVLDMYTIQRAKDRLEDLKVVIGGDLKHGRTVKSLAHLLSQYRGNHLSFVSTPDLRIGATITDHLKATNTSYEEVDDIYSVVPDADVVYWTRLQKERLENPDLESSFVIDHAVMQEMSDQAILMHPLPRVGEIEPSVDNDSRAVYFDQTENGLYIRMALLDGLFTDRAV
jgi:aspartate carbamoyltransferase catalytic subunit